MNVALATATAQAPLSVMAARSGVAADKQADTGTLPAVDPSKDNTAVKVDTGKTDTGKTETGKSDQDLPIMGRYPRVAVRYDQDASRLVLLFRDPADGATLDQIPTEAALKQYKEAQKDRKDGKPSLQLLVGGAGGEQARQPGQGTTQGSDGSATGSGSGSPGKGVASPHTTFAPPPKVVHSSPVSTHVAAQAGSGSGRVNVVI